MASPIPFNILDTAIGDRVLYSSAGDSQALIVSSAGTITMLASAVVDRAVIINVVVTTTYANGDGAQPTVAIGQTGNTTKFAATSAFTGKTAGTTLAFGGVLTKNTALIITATAGTGTTETGAMTVTAIAAQSV